MTALRCFNAGEANEQLGGALRNRDFKPYAFYIPQVLNDCRLRINAGAPRSKCRCDIKS